APFAELTHPLESTGSIAARKKDPVPNLHFLIGRDTSEQANAIAMLALSFLNSPSCESVAILLPGPGALARLAAHALDEAAIAHNDSIAHAMRGIFDDEEWRAWLEFQKYRQVDPLLRFLAHSPAAVGFFSNIRPREVDRALRRACGDILINDVDV